MNRHRAILSAALLITALAAADSVRAQTSAPPPGGDHAARAARERAEERRRIAVQKQREAAARRAQAEEAHRRAEARREAALRHRHEAEMWRQAEIRRHREAEAAERRRVALAVPTPHGAPGEGWHNHPYTGSREVRGTWQQNGSAGSFVASFRGDRLVNIREVMRDRHGEYQDDFTYGGRYDRPMHFDGDLPAGDYRSQRIHQTITWDSAGHVTSSRRVYDGQSGSVSPSEARVIYGHGNDLRGYAYRRRGY